MNKKNKEKNILNLIAILLLSLIIIIFILAFLSTRDKDNAKNEEEAKIITKEDVNEIKSSVRKINVSEKGERDRMEYYFSEFLDAVESENYEEAYNMLYDDFRKNYFPNLSDFEEYAKKTFPKFASIEHTNFERNGKIYVMWINISDAINGTKDSAVEMNIVIQENDLNDFKLSFSVI